MPENLFFLAVIPPEPTYSAISHLKTQFAEQYNSRHALKSPPHITVIPPFWYHSNKIDDLVGSVRELLAEYGSFQLKLKDFDCFKPRVIFVDVVDSTNKLHELQIALKSFFLSQFKLRPEKRDTYHPHCTIGFKDLSPKMFYKAWDYFKDQTFNRNFTVEALSLLQYEEGTWKRISSIDIG